MPAALTLAAVAAVTLALATDLRARRIPNWLTGGSALVGLLAGFWLHGPPGGLSALTGGLLGFALLLPFYALGGVGAGDVKLLAALGTLIGPHDLLSVAF